MSAADYLAEIEARAEAATEGPWERRGVDEVHAPKMQDRDEATDVATIFDPGADAEFIAHARTDVPALVAALRAVLDELDQWERVGHLSIEMVHIRRRIEQALGGD